MKKLLSFLIPFFILAALFTFFYFFIKTNPITIFSPKGIVAQQEKQLIIAFIVLMLLVALPAVVLTFFVAWKYRATNTKATYTPDAHHSKKLEILWWLVPTGIVLILATLTWKMTHILDPYQPLKSTIKPITIQVVALQWKWLFIYPEQQIATVNFIQFPVNTPVNFQLTADAPMNSFWIPQLGGQMYAMSGMITQLHLMTDHPGEYAGSTAEISGAGFAGMRFTAKASSQRDFEVWVQSVKKSKQVLTSAVYAQLAHPSENMPVIYYASVEKDLYNQIVMKDMKP